MDDTTAVEIILVLTTHLDHDGKMRAAADLRARALAQSDGAAAKFFETTAAALERYAEEVAASAFQVAWVETLSGQNADRP